MRSGTRAVRRSDVRISLNPDLSVSGLLLLPDRACACYVMAHGAGAAMTHRFMEAVADGLAHGGVATLRYQFPYIEKGSNRPDSPAVARATVRAAVDDAAKLATGLPLFAGGKSFGGRMTSQAQAESPLSGVRGLVFFGFPLHPAGKPSDERARHLADVQVPMLFLQGTRDTLAEMRLLAPLVERLGMLASLRRLEGANHSFHVPVRSGRTDKELLASALDAVVGWMQPLL